MFTCCEYERFRSRRTRGAGAELGEGYPPRGLGVLEVLTFRALRANMLYCCAVSDVLQNFVTFALSQENFAKVRLCTHVPVFLSPDSGQT